MIDQLLSWQDHYEVDDVFDENSRPWQNALISAMRGHEPRLGGFLYRAVNYVDDGLIYDLINNKTVTIEPFKSKLVSWAKSLNHASSYLRYDDEYTSGLIIKCPIDKLHPIFDFDTLPGAIEAGEVLCLNEKQVVNIADVPALVFCDYDGKYGPKKTQRFFINGHELSYKNFAKQIKRAG